MDDAPATATTQPIRRRRSTTAKQALTSATAASGNAKVGRPLTYSPALCDRAIALGQRGKHWAAIARDFNINRATLYQWAADFPEFNDALSRARAYAQAWWEDDLQRNRKAKHYQANAVRLVMQGQFKEDYSEQRSAADLGFDLGAFVGALAGQLAKAPAQPGDSAKAVDVTVEKDDAAPKG